MMLTAIGEVTKTVIAEKNIEKYFGKSLSSIPPSITYSLLKMILKCMYGVGVAYVCKISKQLLD
jgi:hypothetical protein